jgi:hypothetical protein
VTVHPRGCNMPAFQKGPISLGALCALALLQEGPWYGFAPDRI